MIRLMAFVLALCCCCGLIWGTARALEDRSDDLSFAEHTILGDPSVLDGRVMRAAIRCGDHMRWETTYTFGEQMGYDTRFLFSQEGFREPNMVSGGFFNVYGVSGFGCSTTGSVDFTHTGFGEMIRAVAAMTPPGESREMNLKLSDYVNYHVLNYQLSYQSDRVFCEEYVDAMDFYVDRWGKDAQGNLNEWIRYNASASYAGFSELFRFPVGTDEIVTISVSKDDLGNVVDVNFYPVSGRDIGFVTAVNDRGVYCVPVFRQELDGVEAIAGEYARGMGIYFIPWRPLTEEEGNRNGQNTPAPATLDTDRAENLYPLPKTTVVWGLEMEAGGKGAWLLSLEDGVYLLSRVDLEHGRVTHRIPVLERTERTSSPHPTWYCDAERMIVVVSGQMALVCLDGDPEVEFVVEPGESMEGLAKFDRETGAIWYDGEVLILADTDEYTYGALEILAYDKGGAVYWGEYKCGVFDCNEPGYTPWIYPDYQPVTVE